MRAHSIAVRPGVRTIAVVSLLLLFVGCSGARDITASDPQRQFAEQFESVWKNYDTTYAYFDYKRIDWDSLGRVYRPKAMAATSESELAGVIGSMLGELRDVHAWLVDPRGASLATYSPSRPINWRKDVWLSYVTRWGWHGQIRDWGYSRIGSVPYLVFGEWLTSDFSSAAVDSVLELFRDAPAIIIDVRMNSGGDESLALAVASRFYDMRRVATYVRYRNGPRHGDLGPFQPLVVDRRGSWQFTKPVLVLVGRGCFSSTEAFVAAMQVLPNVTVVGDTTGGGSGNPRTFSLGGGWQYSVPRWIEYTSTMDVIEWNGIAPNVVVPVSDADWSGGRDPVLDYAARWAAERAGPPGDDR